MSTQPETRRQIGRTERLLVSIARHHEFNESLRALAEAFEKLVKEEPLHADHIVAKGDKDKDRAP